MGLIDSGSKSSRLLASRRYTHNTFTTAQESFTNVLDLRSEEIYTRAHLIPSSSLPFSGSSQLGLTHSVNNQPVVKYWYRQQLTKSNTNNEVWFFLNPSGSGDGIGAQLINDNQQTNFVSPKYSLATLASSTTEDSTPGYLAVLYKSTAVASSEETSSLGSGDIVSTNDYIFDYKTGVVQFLNSTKDPSDSEYVYMTAYQYVGDTLKSGLEVDGEVTASNLLVTGTLKTTNIESTEMTLATASIAAITSSVSRINDDITLATASIAAITSSLSTISGTGELQGLGTTSSPLFNSVTASADVSASGKITSTRFQIDGTSHYIDSSLGNLFIVTTGDIATQPGTGKKLTVAGNFYADGHITASGNISASGNIQGTGNLDIDGTSNFASDVTIDSDLDVTGTITATEIHTTFISSSISVATGSNNFGDSTDDHHSFTGSLSVSSSLAVTGSTTIDGTLTVDEIGAFTAGGAIDFNDQNMTNVDIDSGDITGVTFGTATSTIISGSSTALSSSIATRFDARETDMTLATASIASNETNMTLATASIASITSSIARLDSETETNDANMTLATASIAAITASVSRIDTEIDTNTTNITLATASIAAITSSLGTISGTGELQGLGTTSSPLFNSITASAGISSSGRVYVNNSFPQLKLSDDGYTDHAKIGLLGDSIYLQGSDTSIGVRLRRSDNFDIARFIMNTETTEISGSGGLYVKTHITASGNISASGNIYGANITASSGISSTDLYIDDYIYHNDDTDTYIGYPTGDKIDFVAGGINFVRAWQKDDDTDKLWFNPNEEPMNFRFYTNENSPGLRISGSGHVGMFGISKPSASVHMGGNLWVESHITASGNISSSGTIYADNFTSTGGNVDGISFADDLDITGNITASGGVSVGEMSIPSVSTMSSSIATRFDSRETDMTLATASIVAITASISRIDSEIDTTTANMTLATASIEAITSSIARLDSETETNDANMTLATASITAITASISRIDSEIDTNAANMTLATASISVNETGLSLATASIAAITASVAEMKEFTKAATISGSFTALSSSLASRLTAEEGEAEGSVVSSSAQIAVEISGSFTSVSSSIATRFDSRETDMTLATASIALNESNMTLATASIAALTASISRLNDEISTDDTDMNLATASIAAITASIAEMKEFTKAATISGSFTSVSSSIATRFDAREVDMTLATASIAAITASVAEMKEFTKAATISGSFTSVSSSIATRFDSRETDMTLATASIAALTASISRLNDEISTDDTDMTLATASIAAITASISRIDSEIDTNAANITLATASIAAITASLGQPVNTDSDVTFGDITSTGTITAVEIHTTFISSSISVATGSNNFGDDTSDHHSFTGSLSVSSSLSVTGSTTIDGTLTVDEIGAFTAGGAIDFGDQNMTNVDIDSGDITGVTFGTATSTTISGSTTAVSSSIATRFDLRETDMTLATASIAAITASVAEMKEFTNATTISGSFTAVSSSIATRFDTNESNMTLATASITAITSSIARLDSETETNDANMTLATASIAAITASISRLDSEIDDAGIFESTGSFYRTHNDIQITGSLSVSGLITGSYSGLEVGQKYKHSQDTAASTWTVSHGFDYQYVNIDVYNGSDELVIPASVVATDSNTITISFNTPLSGVAIVSTGGQAVDELGKNVIFEQPTVATNWRVTHSIGEQYPAVTVYDDSDNVIIPERINAVDASHMDIIFTNAVSGNANISVGGGSQLRLAITGSEQLSFDNFGDISGSAASTGSFGRLEVVGNGNIDGNLTLGGNITIGDADSDSITINADLTSNLVPNTDSTYDIGSTSKYWRNAYIDTITTTGNISGSVSSTGSFGNVNVSEMSIPSVSTMSSSIATRFDSRETDMTLATASIAANVTNMTLATASIAAITASISRLDTESSLATASIAAITASVAEMKEFTNADTISGSFTSVSSSIASRLDSLSGDVIALSIALG